MEDPAEPPRKTYQLRTTEKFERANARPGEEDPAGRHDVRAWRADQIALESRAGTSPLPAPVPPPVHRRRRDCWTLLIANNLGFGAAAYFGQANPLIFAGGLAGMFLGSVVIYWILYHIMGRY